MSVNFFIFIRCRYRKNLSVNNKKIDITSFSSNTIVTYPRTVGRFIIRILDARVETVVVDSFNCFKNHNILNV